MCRGYLLAEVRETDGGYLCRSSRGGRYRVRNIGKRDPKYKLSEVHGDTEKPVKYASIEAGKHGLLYCVNLPENEKKP